MTVDWTPFAFSVTGVSLFLAIYRFGFMDIAPIARDIVVDTIDDAMVVVDDQGRVIDYNPAFADLFRVDGDIVGSDVDAVFAEYPPLRSAIEDAAETDIVAVETPDGHRDLEVTVSPIEDERDRTLGRAVVLHDVT